MTTLVPFTERPFTPEGPQPLLREIPAGAPYPEAALGPLLPAVRAVQGETQAPIAIPAASALAVAALAVQGFADVETLGGQRPLSLYLLTIARSGERKSSCDKLLLEPLTAFEKGEAIAFREEFAVWQNRHAAWKAQRDGILAALKSAKGEKRIAGEADLEALGPEPPAPPSPDRVVTEPTFEGLTKLFVHGPPSLALLSDEGGQFLGGHAMNSDNRQKSLAAFNALWMGDPIRRTRAGDGAFTLYGRRLAIHLMVQPHVAQAFMSDPLATDIGFLSRFLISEPPSTIGFRFHASSRCDKPALDAFGARLRAILETPLPMDSKTRELHPRLLPLSAQAQALVIRFADCIEEKQRPGGELANATAAASKAAEQACRLAAVLTLWGDLGAPEVGLDEMEWGITLAQFYLSEAVRLADAAVVTAATDRAERLRRWLLEAWPHDEVLLREVLQYAPIRALRESGPARAALTTLEEHGWLVRLSPGAVIRDKARKEAWRIVREKRP